MCPRSIWPEVYKRDPKVKTIQGLISSVHLKKWSLREIYQDGILQPSNPISPQSGTELYPPGWQHWPPPEQSSSDYLQNLGEWRGWNKLPAGLTFIVRRERKSTMAFHNSGHDSAQLVLRWSKMKITGTEDTAAPRGRSSLPAWVKIATSGCFTASIQKNLQADPALITEVS